MSVPARASGGAVGAARRPPAGRDSGCGAAAPGALCPERPGCGSRTAEPGSSALRGPASVAASPLALPQGPLEAPRLRVGAQPLSALFPLWQAGEPGWRWLRPRSRLGRAVMQTERHRESCSEGSGRILTCLSATVSRLSPFPPPSPEPRAAIAVAAVGGDAGTVRRLLSPAVDVSRGKRVRSFPRGRETREPGPAVQRGSRYFTAPSRAQPALTAAAAAGAYFSLIHDLNVRLGTRRAPRGSGSAWSMQLSAGPCQWSLKGSC